MGAPGGSFSKIHWPLETIGHRLHSRGYGLHRGGHGRWDLHDGSTAMSASGSESRSALVLELAEEFLDRYRAGQRPPLREYIERHPELAAEIREVFPAMAMMEHIALADDS